jgi:hypothetical protein
MGVVVRDEVLVAQWHSAFRASLQHQHQPPVSSQDTLSKLWGDIQSDTLAMQCLLDAALGLAPAEDEDEDNDAQGYGYGYVGGAGAGAGAAVLAVYCPMLWQGLKRTEAIAAEACVAAESLTRSGDTEANAAKALKSLLIAEKTFDLLQLRAKVVDLLKRLTLFQFLLQSEAEVMRNLSSKSFSELDFFLYQDLEEYCQRHQWSIGSMCGGVRGGHGRPLLSLLEVLMSLDVSYLGRVMAWLAASGRVAGVAFMLGCFPGHFLRSVAAYCSDVLDLLPLGLDPVAYCHLLPVPVMGGGAGGGGGGWRAGESLVAACVTIENTEELELAPISICYKRQSCVSSDTAMLTEWVTTLQDDVVTWPVVELALTGGCLGGADPATRSLISLPEEEADEAVAWYFRRVWAMERFGQTSCAASLCSLAVERLELGTQVDTESDSTTLPSRCRELQELLLRELSIQLRHFCSLLYGFSLPVSPKDNDDDCMSTCSVKLLPPETSFAEWAVQPVFSRVTELVTSALQWQAREGHEAATSSAAGVLFLQMMQEGVLPLLFGPKRLFCSLNTKAKTSKLVEMFIAMTVGMGLDESDLNFIPFGWRSWTSGARVTPPGVDSFARNLVLRPAIEAHTLSLLPAVEGVRRGAGCTWSHSGFESLLVAALVSVVSLSGEGLSDRALVGALHVAKQSLPTLPREQRLLSDSTQLGHLVLLACRAYNTVTDAGVARMWELLETTPVQFTKELSVHQEEEGGSVFTEKTRDELKRQLDLLQAALSVCEVLSLYLVMPAEAMTWVVPAHKPQPSLTLSMLLPRSAHDRFERRKFTQVLLHGTGHFVAGLEYLQTSQDNNHSGIYAAEQTTFEHALILHCCSHFLETSAVASNEKTDTVSFFAAAKNQRRIAGSTLLTGLNFVARRVSHRLTQVSSTQTSAGGRVKEHLHALDHRAEQCLKLCDDLLTLVNFLTTLGTASSSFPSSSFQSVPLSISEQPSSAISCKWTGQVIFQTLLQCALASEANAQSQSASSSECSEREFFSRLCCAICSPHRSEKTVATTSSIDTLANLFWKEFGLRPADIYKCLKMRTETAFNASSSCTLSLYGEDNVTRMEEGLQEAAYLCETAKRVIATQNQSEQPHSYTKDARVEMFEEEWHLLSVVNFVRHLDLLLEHRRDVAAAATAATLQKSDEATDPHVDTAKDTSVDVGMDVGMMAQKQSQEVETHEEEEGLDFVPCQLRLLGPVEVARRVLRACPRAYRTAFVYSWSTQFREGYGGAGGDATVHVEEEDGEEDVDDDDSSDDDPLALHGLLTRGGGRERQRCDEEAATRQAFIVEESAKLFPISGDLRKHQETVNVVHMTSDEDNWEKLSSTEGSSRGDSEDEEEDEDDEDEDDALLLQYRRSQTSLGSGFLQIMLGLPAGSAQSNTAQRDTSREIETSIYAEVTCLFCSTSLVS